VSFLLRKKKEQTTSILFATDMHGSEGVWRKFLNASAMLKVNAAICGGDLTGKMIVPVVEQENRKFAYYFMGKQHIIEKDEVDVAFKNIRGIGYYPYLTNWKKYDEMTKDTMKVDEVFHEVMISTLKNWLDLIPQKVPPETKVIVCPGNDDRVGVDKLVSSHKSVLNGEGTVIEIDESHAMVSCGWVNPSPWKTAREEEEDKLEERLEKYLSRSALPNKTGRSAITGRELESHHPRRKRCHGSRRFESCEKNDREIPALLGFARAHTRKLWFSKDRQNTLR
jgi:Icc-related predicted phosphoesterase